MSHVESRVPPDPGRFAAMVDRAAPEYRRSMLYVACGGVLAMVLVASVPQPVPQPFDPLRLVPIGLVYFVLPLTAWLYMTDWRLRVDEAGIWRRRLGCWSCWDWETIAGGKIHYQRRNGLLWNSARPWWDKAIGIGLLGKGGKPVLELLNVVFSDEQCDDIVGWGPAEIAWRTWFPFRWIRIGHDGIAIDHRGERNVCRWEQIERLRLVGYPHGEMYVYSIELFLPGRDSQRGSLAGVWADGERCLRVHVRDAQWTRQLESIVPPAKWERFDMSGDVRSIEEGRYRIEFWRKWSRSCLIFPVLAVLHLSLLAWKFVPGMWAIWFVPMPLLWKLLAILGAFLTMVMPATLFGILWWHTSRQFLEHQHDAERQIREILDAGECPPCP